jgi:hypothetical protein
MERLMEAIEYRPRYQLRIGNDLRSEFLVSAFRESVVLLTIDDQVNVDGLKNIVRDYFTAKVPPNSETPVVVISMVVDDRVALRDLVEFVRYSFPVKIFSLIIRAYGNFRLDLRGITFGDLDVRVSSPNGVDADATGLRRLEVISTFGDCKIVASGVSRLEKLMVDVAGLQLDESVRSSLRAFGASSIELIDAWSSRLPGLDGLGLFRFRSGGRIDVAGVSHLFVDGLRSDVEIQMSGLEHVDFSNAGTPYRLEFIHPPMTISFVEARLSPLGSRVRGRVITDFDGHTVSPAENVTWVADDEILIDRWAFISREYRIERFG